MPDEFTQEEKQQIIQNLRRFPHIDKIIKKDRNFFRKYSARNFHHIAERERDERLEFTLANILKNLHVPSFLKMIQQLDEMISHIPIDHKLKFGRKLNRPDFFSTFSEIEVYYNLILRGKKPYMEQKVSLNGNNVDFGFFLWGKFFLVEVKTPRGSGRLKDYFDSLPSNDSDPGIHIGVGFIDEKNQLLIDAKSPNLGSNNNSRVYPRESSRIVDVIFEDFIGGNLRNIENPFSSPIILIINYEIARSIFPFSYDTLDLIASIMREDPPKECQGVIVYPPAMPIVNSPIFFPNPNYDFSSDEIQFFSSLMRTNRI